MKYVTMLPFLSAEDLKELAFKVINGETKGVKLILLFPFLDTDTLDEIVEKLIVEKKGKELRGALPFVSKKIIGKIYSAVVNEELTGIRKEMLLPFLDQSQIKEMFEELVKNAENEEDLDDEEVEFESDDE